MVRAIYNIGTQFLSSFLPWVVLWAPLGILRSTVKLLRIWLEIFSVPFLLRTLLSPWKRISDIYSGSGLNISRLAQTLTLNLTSRIVGMMIRSISILLSVSILVVVLSIEIGLLFFWVGLPLLMLRSAVELDAMPRAFLVASGLWAALIAFAYLRYVYIHRNDGTISKAERKFIALRTSDEKDLPLVRSWYHRKIMHRETRRLFSELTLIRLFGGFGRSWVTGFTDELKSLTERILDHGKFFHLLHRDKIEEILHLLTRGDRDNVIVVGEPGIGKEVLTMHLTRVLRLRDSRKFRSSMQFLRLRTDEIISARQDPDRFLLTALKRAEIAGTFTLVIDDLTPLLSEENEAITNVLTEFLKSPSIHVLTYATPSVWRKTIKSHPFVETLFARVDLSDVSIDDCIPVLTEEADEIETGRTVCTIDSIREVALLASRHIKDEVLPGSAVRLLRESLLEATKQKSSVVKKEHVRRAVSRIANIDLAIGTEDQREELLDLESDITLSIIGQDHAVSKISAALRKAKQGLGSKEKPLGSYLFLGPTGVGKTEMAKSIASQSFGSEDAIVRLDLNHYVSPESISDIVGDRDSQGVLAHAIQESPSSLVLLDEIEKAYPSILDLFLQVLDEGLLIDHDGNETDFRSSIIVATSNAGADYIQKMIEEGVTDAEVFEKKLIDHLLRQGIFRPEFLNRFDEVIVFSPLSRDALSQIATKLITEVADRFAKEEGLTLKVAPEVVARVIEQGSSARFGAREMQRAVADLIENTAAKKILEEGLGDGDTVEISE